MYCATSTHRCECQNASRGCADCKKELACYINNHFKPIREKRKELESQPKLIKEIIEDGSQKARAVAKDVLQQVREKVNMY